MRDVKAYTPEPIVLKLPQRRTLADGAGETLDEATGRWGRIHPILVSALDSLERGLPFEELYERALVVAGELKPSHVRAYLRRYLWQLERQGHLRIPIDPPPAIFDGRFRHVQELGRGGAGIAHLCVDEKTGGEVVVKHAWGWLSPIDRADRVIRREAEVLRHLQHPGIVRHHAEFERDGLHHLVRGYAQGGSVRTVAADRRRAFAHAAADALAHVHERGYLFLDFTPGNLVVQADGSPLILDVGTCHPHADGRLALGGSTGSRGYAAPEMMDTKTASLRSDVFSFGCFYHFLLLGRAPGHRWTLPQRAEALAGAEPAERDLVLRLCADAPEDRPADMRAVQALLAA